MILEAGNAGIERDARGAVEAETVHHRERARAELDLAHRALTPAAAQAHLGLASLHLRRIADLASAASGSGPSAPRDTKESGS
jgi:hypothetical protein